MICVTGTPGTGKTKIMEELRKRGYSVHEFDSISEECVSSWEDQEKVLDEDCLRRIEIEGIAVGHLSHYAKCSSVIVLRGHLKDISSRLRDRGYSSKKITDNLECEAIDLIGYEAKTKHPSKTIEILNENLEETLDIIENIIAGKKFTSKNIDLTEEILDWY